MAWIRSQTGGLYNLAHIVSLRVEGGQKDGESVDMLVARLHDGTKVELAWSGYGIDDAALADVIRRGETLIDVIADGIVGEGAEAGAEDEVV